MDKNQDAQLDAGEVEDVMHMEAERRIDTNTAHMPPGRRATDAVAEASPAEVVQEIDADGDGEVSQTEYKAEGEGGSDMGEEMQEASEAQEDETDPDDLHRVDAKAAELLS